MKRYLYFNPDLKEKVKYLRQNQTPFEKTFWYDILHKECFKNFKWIRQKAIDEYIVDFFCFDLMLAIEIDGETHTNKNYDLKRTEKLKEYGIKIIRYTNNEVKENFEGICEDLLLNIKKRMKENNKLNPLAC